MDIKDFKALKELIKICRKTGVSDIEVDGIKIKLGDAPSTEKPQSHMEEYEEPEDPFERFPSGILSPTQAAFYSSGGVPEDDPELEENPQ